MSKIETVKSLDDTSPQLQIVRSMAQIQQDLQTLPEAVAVAISERLQPLESLPDQVQQALVAYDRITAAQRQSLETMAREIASLASQALETRAEKLAKTLFLLSGKAADLQQATQEIRSLPQDLQQATEKIQRTTHHLPTWRRQMIMAISAALIAALVALIGQGVFGKLLPPGSVQQEAQTMRNLWTKSTPGEQKLIQNILQRPAK